MTKNEEKLKISERQRKAFASIGRIGGKATHAKHGSEYMSKIGKKGAKVRKAKAKKSK